MSKSKCHVAGVCDWAREVETIDKPSKGLSWISCGDIWAGSSAIDLNQGSIKSCQATKRPDTTQTLSALQVLQESV